MKKSYDKDYEILISKIIPKWYNEFLNKVSEDILNGYAGRKVYDVLKKELSPSLFQKLNDESKYKYENMVVKAFNLLRNDTFAFTNYIEKNLKTKGYTSDILLRKILNFEIVDEWCEGGHNATVLVSKMQYSGFGTLKDMKRGIQLQFFNKMERELTKIYERIALELIKPNNIKKLENKLIKN